MMSVGVNIALFVLNIITGIHSIPQNYDRSGLDRYYGRSLNLGPPRNSITTSYGPPKSTYAAPPSLDKTQIFKHVFVHVAPDMPAPPPIYIPYNQQQRKHYNLVFIKTPSMPAPEIILPKVHNDNSEKTLIYVLNENPKPIQAPVLNVDNQLKATKPEVFLIKYNGDQNGAPAYNSQLSSRSSTTSGAQIGSFLQNNLLGFNSQSAKLTVKPNQFSTQSGVSSQANAVGAASHSSPGSLSNQNAILNQINKSVKVNGHQGHVSGSYSVPSLSASKVSTISPLAHNKPFLSTTYRLPSS